MLGLHLMKLKVGVESYESFQMNDIDLYAFVKFKFRNLTSDWIYRNKHVAVTRCAAIAATVDVKAIEFFGSGESHERGVRD